MAKKVEGGPAHADNRKVLREIAKILNIREEDVPKTLERFRKEVADMEEVLGKS